MASSRPSGDMAGFFCTSNGDETESSKVTSLVILFDMVSITKSRLPVARQKRIGFLG
jgi:hypothetical protein